jgi:regulator of RNase E activity RraA
MQTGQVTRPPAALVEAFGAISTPTISNAMDRLGLHGIMRGLKPVVPGRRCVGGAITVHEVTGELGNVPPEALPLGQLVDIAEPGDVIVVDNGGQPISTWGGVATFAAKTKGIAGLVVDGAVRDYEDIERLGFPVFSRHVVPVTGVGRIKALSLNMPIRADGVAVRPGDIVVADGSGVAVIPIAEAERVLELAKRQDAKDQRIVSALREGASFSEALRKGGAI